MKGIVLGVVLAAAVLGTVIYLRGGVSLREPGAEPGRGKVMVTRRQGLDAVLSITPNAAVERTASGDELSPRVSPLMQELATTRDYRGLLQRIESSAARTPEQDWVQAEILSRCATQVAMRAAQPKDGASAGREEALKSFSASLSEKDPARDKRIEAMKAVTSDRCDGVRMPRPGETAELVAKAAAAGDPKARVALLREQVFADMGKPGASRNIDTSRHLGGIKAAFESGDPVAMLAASNLLSLPGGNVSLRAGEHEIPVDHGTFRRAVQALGCELGVPCGPGSEALATACAYQGACDVRDLRDYYLFYGLSPHQSQLLAQYVGGLRRVVRSRDWTFFNIRTGVPQPSYSVMP